MTIDLEYMTYLRPETTHPQQQLFKQRLHGEQHDQNEVLYGRDIVELPGCEME